MKFFSSFLSALLTSLLIALPMQAQIPAPPVAGNSAQAGVMQVRLLDSGASSVAVNSVNDTFTIQVVDGTGAPVPDAAVALRMPEEGPTGFFSNGTRTDVVYTDSKGQAKFTQVHWGPNPGKAVIRVTVVKGALRAGALIEETVGATAVSLPQVAQTPPPAPPPPQATPKQAPAKVAAKINTPPTPGTPVSVATAHSGATSAAIPSSASSESGGVSVTNTSATNSGAGQSGISKKWIIVAAVAAGAGVGAALALSGHHGSTTTTPGLTIGTPTLSVGH